jgi:transcriptional regulator with XRE-family HTH domain
MVNRESLHRLVDELYNRIDNAEHPRPRRLVEVRKKAGLRQQDVACEINVSQATVSNMEQGLKGMELYQKQLYIRACGATLPLTALWPDGTLWLLSEDQTPQRLHVVLGARVESTPAVVGALHSHQLQ